MNGAVPQALSVDLKADKLGRAVHITADRRYSALYVCTGIHCTGIGWTRVSSNSICQSSGISSKYFFFIRNYGEWIHGISV